MFKRLTFGRKIVSMPALAGFGSIVVVIVAVVLGGRSRDGLTAIETGYSPSLESSRALEQGLVELQRALQDAVAAGEADDVAKADELAAAFTDELARLEVNPVVAATEVDELRGAFTAYFDLARATTLQMITGEGSGDLMANLKAMTASFSALQESLQARTEADRERISAAFVTARGLQRTSTGATVLILLAVVAALAALSAWIVRDVLGALGGIAGAAEAIAGGDIDQSIEYRGEDEVGRVAEAFRGMIAYMQELSVAVDGLARGDLEVTVRQRSEHDLLAANVRRAISTLTEVTTEMAELIRATEAGDLRRRGTPDAFQGAYAELVGGANRMLDAVASPIEEASEVLAGLACGDLRRQMTGTYHGAYADLADSLNTTVVNLSDALGRIRGASSSVGASSGELQSMSTEMTRSAELTTLETEQVSQASRTASSNVVTVASAAEEMSSSIQEISSQVHEAHAVSDDATRKAESTVELMAELGEASTQIGQVVGVITSIAEQTNLLALNATIEAARAGEAGHGFAVVAHEVKVLAAQTAKATEEIEAKIQSVQGRTEGAVESIRRIAEVIARVNQISVTVAGAVEEQSAAVGEIARSASDASDGTDQVARGLASVSEAAAGTAGGAERLRGSAAELAGVVTTLDALVNEFELPGA